MNAEPHFEGERFHISIVIDGDNWFSNESFETDYDGYMELKQLLEKLNPSKPVIE